MPSRSVVTANALRPQHLTPNTSTQNPGLNPCTLNPVFRRTWESLSAEALVVPSKAVVTADAFKKQSRTSERWLRLREVGVPDLPTFLQEQRAAGYTSIGRHVGTVVWYISSPFPLCPCRSAS